MHKFRFLEVTNEEMLQEVFAFRYKIFLETFPEYTRTATYKNELEFDKYDPYSLHFVALDENDKICATVRLVYNSPVGYPTEGSADFDKSQFERDKLGELSRIFIDAKYRDMKTTRVIIKSLSACVYNKMKELDIEYSYGLLEENFLRLLRIYKMHYYPIGELQKIGLFGNRYPCILYTDELGANLHEN